MGRINNNNIMKYYLFAFWILLYCNPIMSHNTKGQKKILKALKKEYNLSYASFNRDIIDNFAYIRMYTKNHNELIADSLGNIIIPNSNQSQTNYISIHYEPERKGGFKKRYENNSLINRFYVGNQGCFVAQDRMGTHYFYDRTGAMTTKYAGILYRCFNLDAYWVKSVSDDGKNLSDSTYARRNNVGLIYMDGTPLIPTEYADITTTISGLCYVSQYVEGVIRHGIIDLAHTTTYEKVPCLFNKVVISKNGKNLLVRKHELDSFVVYSPDSTYSISYIDEGERLFESGQYDEAQKYYFINKDSIPWANAYLGVCRWKMAESEYRISQSSIDDLKVTTSEYGRDKANTAYRSLDQFQSNAQQAIEQFDLYLQGQDNKFKLRIKEIKYEITRLMEDAVILRNSIAPEIEAYEYRRKAYLEEQQNEQKRKENEKYLQQHQQWIDNQRMHEINERNRIALERERERRKKQAEQNKKGNTNSNTTPSQTNNNRWSNSTIPIHRRGKPTKTVKNDK